jgi:hypothetical protein
MMEQVLADTKQCVCCAETIKAYAKFCNFCGRNQSVEEILDANAKPESNTASKNLAEKDKAHILSLGLSSTLLGLLVIGSIVFLVIWIAGSIFKGPERQPQASTPVVTAPESVTQQTASQSAPAAQSTPAPAVQVPTAPVARFDSKLKTKIAKGLAEAKSTGDSYYIELAQPEGNYTFITPGLNQEIMLTCSTSAFASKKAFQKYKNHEFDANKKFQAALDTEQIIFLDAGDVLTRISDFDNPSHPAATYRVLSGEHYSYDHDTTLYMNIWTQDMFMCLVTPPETEQTMQLEEPGPVTEQEVAVLPIQGETTKLPCSWMFAVTAEALDKYIKAEVNKDDYGMAELLKCRAVVFLPKNTAVLGIDSNGFLGSVRGCRILDGRYAGLELWAAQGLTKVETTQKVMRTETYKTPRVLPLPSEAQRLQYGQAFAKTPALIKQYDAANTDENYLVSGKVVYLDPGTVVFGIHESKDGYQAFKVLSGDYAGKILWSAEKLTR